MTLKHIALVIGTAAVLAAGGAAPLYAQRARDFSVSDVRNNHAPFLVRISVDRADRVYRDGDAMKVTVRSAKPGYLYVINEGASGKLNILFPNKFQPDNRIKASQDITLPAAAADYAFTAGAPFGKEVVKAIVTLKPIEGLVAVKPQEASVTPITTNSAKQFYVNELQPNPTNWGEHQVEVLTVRSGDQVREPRRRIGAFIGISKYADPRIPQLSVCHYDAETMAKTMKKCGLTETIVLTDENASLKNIEKALREDLVKKSRPGDLVVIYWSGHGGRTADDSGDESDGLDEYLVPADGKLGKSETMLLDDHFGRYLRDLDGRQVVVILDACHSGGQATLEKSLGALTAKGIAPRGKSLGASDFLDGEILRAKDIGQKELSMLAAAKASESAFERQEGDLSVMTYYLVKLLEAGADPLALPDAHKAIMEPVAGYIKRHLPGATQSPVLVDNATKPILIRESR